MKKYLQLAVAAIIALVFVGTFVFLYRKSRPKETVYNEFVSKRADIRKTTVITGRIEPRDEVSVKPQISGIITQLYKQAGDRVDAGEVIARVKVIPDMGQLSSAEARVRLAEVNLAQARVDHQRMQNLYRKQLVSDDAYDKVHQSLVQAEEEKAAATDALEVVRDGVSRRNAKASSTLIRSTISGVVLDVPVKVGNTVVLSNTFNDGTTIASVADMNDLIFRGNIDETEVGRLVQGMSMRITVGALHDLAFDATLEYISPKAVEQGGANQFEVKAAVRVEGDVYMRSGYSANAEIVLEEADKVLSVPESAIEFSGDTAFVYVLEPGTSPKVYRRTRVETGLSDGVDIEIRSGVEEGQTVRGPQKLDAQ
ncbi:MAG: efflux RND transporter periplasmic adaptor subunit [Prevotellaceae bacterium]|nr:efflux RND transporter periplasmic adaptor subunit [Prevotellaceae bacterium]